MNYKEFRKTGPQEALLLFLYKVSIVVLIDFIAIYLTPGIFLIQIVNKNNTNVYLIHFHSKNFFPTFGEKNVFSQKLDFKVSNQSQSFIR